MLQFDYGNAAERGRVERNKKRVFECRALYSRLLYFLCQMWNTSGRNFECGVSEAKGLVDETIHRMTGGRHLGRLPPSPAGEQKGF